MEFIHLVVYLKSRKLQISSKTKETSKGKIVNWIKFRNCNYRKFRFSLFSKKMVICLATGL